MFTERAVDVGKKAEGRIWLMVLGKIVDKSSSRRRRRQAVAAHYVAMSVFIFVWFYPTSVGEYDLFWPLSCLAMAAAVASNVVFYALKNSTQRIAEAWGDGALDERQQEVRDRAYRWAYLILAVFFLIVLICLQFVLLGDPILPDAARASALVPLGIWLTASLPTAIVAWTEPSPELEE